MSSILRRPRGLRRWAGAALAAVTASTLLAGTTGAPSAEAAVTTPGTPRFTAPIEPLASYVGQTTCDPTPKPGVEAFQALVLRTYSNTGSSGISRACTTGGTSEHKEGRAWDWRVNAANATESAQATALLNWLLATDAAGNPYANARRLGIMYIVWNDKTWGSYRAGDGWRPYVHSTCKTIALAQCSGTLRHRDHVHFSFSWPGARKQTSFWAPEAPAPQPSYSLAAYRDSVLTVGSRGAAVTALQKALRMRAISGVYDAATLPVVVAYQKARGLTGSGQVASQTWALLEADLKRHYDAIAAVDHIVLAPGARHSTAVLVLERALRRPADSLYDDNSVGAVKAFQKNHGLSQTGVVDSQTWQALRGL